MRGRGEGGGSLAAAASLDKLLERECISLPGGRRRLKEKKDTQEEGELMHSIIKRETSRCARTTAALQNGEGGGREWSGAGRTLKGSRVELGGFDNNGTHTHTHRQRYETNESTHLD